MRAARVTCTLIAAVSAVLAAGAASGSDSIEYRASVTYDCQGSRASRAAGIENGELTLTKRKLSIRHSKTRDDEVSLAVYRSARPWCLGSASPASCIAKRRKVDSFKVIGAANGVDASYLRGGSAFEDSIATFEGTVKLGPDDTMAKLTGTLTLVDKDSDCIAQLKLKAKAPTGPQPIELPSPAPGPQPPSQPRR